MDITKLTIESMELQGGKFDSCYVTLHGVDGVDLLACADDELIDDLLDKIGADRCVEHFGLELAEEE